MNTNRILVVDHDSQRCSRWVNELAKRADFEASRCLEDLDDIRAMEEELPFDLILINAAGYLAESVIGLLSWKRRMHPGCKAIILDVQEEKGQALQFLEAGAWACLPPQASLQEVMSSLEAAVRGESKLSPAVAGELLQRIRWLSINVPPLGSPLSLQELTPREREILSLVSRRMSNLEIAEQLVLEVGTVKNHVHSVLKKLGVGNRYDAVAYGLHTSTLIDIMST